MLQEYTDISQRQLAEVMGVSVGKVNYCIKALVEVGHIKLNNFKNSKNKLGYVYLLTPKGFKEKTRVTLRFLELKQRQYDSLKDEISLLKLELDRANKNDSRK